jgi:hypothetical protein
LMIGPFVTTVTPDWGGGWIELRVLQRHSKMTHCCSITGTTMLDRDFI